MILPAVAVRLLLHVAVAKTPKLKVAVLMTIALTLLFRTVVAQMAAAKFLRKEFAYAHV